MSEQLIHPYQWVDADTVSEYRQRYDELQGHWESARHDALLPDRHTGRIICRIRLRSPLMIGAQQKPRADDASLVSNYRDIATGWPAIPGSSLRGCVSAVAEALSGSAMRVLDDQQFSSPVRNTHNAFDTHKLPWGSPSRQDTELSPVEAIFGVVEDRSRGEPSSGQHAALLAGRLKFSDARAVQEPQLEGAEAVVFRELSSPKPPSPSMYFKKGSGKRANGHKFYAGHEKPDWKLGSTSADDRAKANRCLKCQPISATDASGQSTCFYFHVDIQNLSEAELGLLLWSLAPDGWGEAKDGGFCHRLGLAKPFGLGQVEIDVLGLWRRDPVAVLMGQTEKTACCYAAEPAEQPEVPAQYANEIGCQTSSSSQPDTPSDQYVLNQALAQLRAIGRPSSTAGRTVSYPRHSVNGQSVVDEEGFKWFAANKSPKGKYQQTHAAPSVETQALTAFKVLEDKDQGR